MRLQGKITRWDDEKGFGFISSDADGSSVFVHIKAFSPESSRPVAGDIVSYTLTKDKNGRPRADKVRFAGKSKAKKPSTRKRGDSPLPLLFASLFVCVLLVAAYLGRISWLIVLVCAGVSVVTFLAYAWDKHSARRGNWRTPEARLHLMGLAGGWPGALAAQRLLRHKSSKQEFLSMFWATVLINVAAVGYLAWRGDANPLNRVIEGLWQQIT